MKHAGLLYFHLREKGIHILEGRPCFLSTAHTEEDLSRIATAFQDSVAELQSAGFLTEAGWDAESSRPSEFTSKIPESTTLPLTAVQQDLWLASQADDDAARAYHLAFVFRLRGELDREALIQALQDLVDRHDALRTCMEGAPDTQTIRSRLTVYLPLTDLSPLSESEREQELKTQAAAEAAALF